MVKKKAVKKVLTPAEVAEKLEASSELVTREVPVLNLRGKVVVRIKRAMAGPSVSYRPNSLQIFEKKGAAAMVKSGSVVMIDPSRDLTVNEIFELNNKVRAKK